MERIAQLKRSLLERCPGLEVREGEPMSRHTTLRIGGPAALMLLPAGEEEALGALACLESWGESPFILGNGSNLLVSDGGYSGVVLKTLGGLGRTRCEEGLLELGSGVLLSQASALALEQGLTGLEFAQGIPGTVGGGVTMNAGAYGGELSQVVRQVTVLKEDGQRETFSGAECRFGYRHSLFAEHPRWLILSCTVALAPGDREEIRDKMADLGERRRSKQPLEYPSAGSTFKRPAPVNGEPRYAAALIDGCGLKGVAIGGAQVSEKHGGFLINRGGATCADMLRLMELVEETVFRETGVELEREIKLLGSQEER